MAAGLKSHIWNNNLKSVVLLALYPVILMAIGWAIFWVGGVTVFGGQPRRFAGYDADPTMAAYESIGFANHMLFMYWPLILSGVAIWFMFSWFFHTSMIRKLSHSHPVTRQQEPELYNLLENLCISRGINMPKLEIIETHARNAFASGIDEKSYSITVTRGLMNSLKKDELEAVLGHELTHIINRDVRLLIITVIFTGLFGFLAQMVWSSVRYRIFYTRGRRDQNHAGVVMLVILIAFILWLGYLATLIMRFALSRRREYMADAGSVELTRNPDAMMRALMRISGRDHIPGTTADIAMMCIENNIPFLGLFSTHPPIAERIMAISKTTGTPVPELPHTGPAARNEVFGTRQPEARPNPWLIRGRRQ